MPPIRGPVYACAGGDFIHIATQIIEGDITWRFAVDVKPMEVIQQALGVGLLSRWSVPLKQIQRIAVNLAIRRKYPVRLAPISVTHPTNTVSVPSQIRSSTAQSKCDEHTSNIRSPQTVGTRT